ncbi:MAG: response regulator transcription factor [Lachnospiraceae bacterium]|nr:response regulator transcription factor [Lachnospiraceae bacterium]
MFRIAICEDESSFREELKKIISECMLKKGLVFKIDTYSSGEKFIALGIEMIQYSIIFLDINMNEVDGIMTAKKIREVSKEAFIIFVTAYVNYTLEGYKVDAIRYLLKGGNNFKSAIDECINAIIEKMNYTIVTKKFNFNEGVRKIALERVLYIESRLHKLEFHVMEEVMKIYTMYETLNNLDNELQDTDFVRIHQSYLVNLKYLMSVARYKAVLTNGTELVIPKARYKYVKEKFIAYRGEV